MLGIKRSDNNNPDHRNVKNTGDCRFFIYTAIILDPSVAGESRDYNTQNKTWTVTFTNGSVVSGIASCNDISGTYAQPYSGNQNNITAGYQTDQLQCWCRMTTPVRSAWVFLNTRTSTSECVSACARFCGMGFRDGATFRAGFFTTAGN